MALRDGPPGVGDDDKRQNAAGPDRERHRAIDDAGHHEAEGAAQGLRLHYQLIDLDATGATVADLPQLVQSMRTIGFRGFNVTYPCKLAILALLDDLSDAARAMGAVNTVVNDGGRLVGHNTDGAGWSWGFQRALPHADLARVVLLGGGGAGSAIADAALRLGVRQLVIVDVDGPRTAALADKLNAQAAHACLPVPISPQR